MIQTELPSDERFDDDNIVLGSKLDDLSKVKDLTHKLQLSIKRRSVLQWKVIIEEKKKKGLLGSRICEPLETSQQNGNRNEIEVNQSGENNLKSQHDVNSHQLKKTSAISNDPFKKISSINGETSMLNPSEQKPKTHTDLDNLESDTESEKRRKISEVLINLRKELILMNLEDHELARKLLDIRRDINRERAALSCVEHAQLLEFVSWEIEEEKELNEMHKNNDVSSALLRKPDSLLSSPSLLRSMRINKTTFEFKRFSVI